MPLRGTRKNTGMLSPCRINLLPLGVDFEVERGASLETVLSGHGVEFPCGGAGICRGDQPRGEDIPDHRDG